MVTIILAEPEHPGNIGSVCRVMSNFGVDELILIDPRCEVTEDTRRFAKNAQDVVKKIRIAHWNVLKEFSVVAATAGKNSTDQNLLRSPLTPKEGAEKLRSVKGGKIALLFGRESNGLTNAELAKADFVITIPTTKQFPSLNVSHSVAVVLYEYYVAAAQQRFTPIPAAEKKVLYEKVDSLLDLLAFSTEGKRATQKKIWRSIFGRAIVTKAESHSALGFFRAIERQQSLLQKAATKQTKPAPRRSTAKQAKA